MSYELYSSLCNVHGFTSMNGSTYQEHIIMIFSELSEDIKKSIIETSSHVDALQILIDNKISYTHDMQF